MRAPSLIIYANLSLCLPVFQKLIPIQTKSRFPNNRKSELKLYVACGISGAIQHLAGMKKPEYVIAITDKDAPIGEIADLLVVADLKQFVPALTEKLKSL